MRLAPRPKVDFKNTGVTRVLKLMVPALFGVSVSQINLLLDTLFASFLIVGSVSWLYYSDRLMEFPLGVFGVAISTVILPHLSRHHASSSPQQYSQTLDWALRMVLLIGIPAAVVLATLSIPLLSTLFHYGRFDDYAVMMARKSLAMFAIGIAPCMLIKVLAAGFYAKQNLRTPVRIGIVAMVSNMALNMTFILPFKHAGIALATSLAALVNAGCLYYYLRRDDIYVPRDGWKYFSLRLLFANSILAVWLVMGAGETSAWLSQSAVWRLSHLFGLLISSVAIYFAALWISGIRVQDLLVPQTRTAKEVTV
jgi:putative peptidoglycan lipid II flippase